MFLPINTLAFQSNRVRYTRASRRSFTEIAPRTPRRLCRMYIGCALQVSTRNSDTLCARSRRSAENQSSAIAIYTLSVLRAKSYRSRTLCYCQLFNRAGHYIHTSSYDALSPASNRAWPRNGLQPVLELLQGPTDLTSKEKNRASKYQFSK